MQSRCVHTRRAPCRQRYSINFKTLNIMAKLYFDGIVVMYDVVANVKQAAALCPASVECKVVED